MTPTVTKGVEPGEALAFLDATLDLGDVRMKLADPQEGPGLSAAQLEVMDAEYRKFLALHLAHPGADIVPCKMVDQIWHQHILDTAAYRRDCEEVFGRFLDHYPYFGMRDEADAQALFDAYAETLERYRDAFGEPPPQTWIAAPEDTSRCRTACKPMRCR